ncbi:hypothetical protein [Haloarcula sp. JP-L23]|uniref:hypothetical protein n=1 Tax=Haloarcula sp. JP-L23 TaxID=2716717 RepID=UPI00140EED14|nr:hypothetical protein G9465_09200 [Haloarcula sp. JP-L23]
MSADTVPNRRFHADVRSSAWVTFRSVLFGDRIGLCLFLASLCLFALFWRTTVFITDTYTLANGLYSLSNGNVFLTEAVYGPGLNTPGAEKYGGSVIARNYGVLVLSLPFLWGLEALDAVADLRIALVALWSLVLLALIVQVGRLTERREVTAGGAVAVLCLFALNVAIARPMDPAPHLHALQLFHMAVAAFAPVLLYRLVARLHTVRTGSLAAVLFVFGTPLAFWAAIPKRHVVTATVVLGVAYALYRSRTAADGVLVSRPLAFRSLSYALVGLYAWVHAPESLLFGVVLAAIDVPTAADNRPQTLAVLAAAFSLSLVPFIVTNTLVAGSPLRPPRLIAAAGESGARTVESFATGGGSGRGGAVLSPLAPVVGLLEAGITPLVVLLRELLAGARALVTDPIDVSRTFVRSGTFTTSFNQSDGEAVNLSLLESAPLLAGVAAVVPVLQTWSRPEPLTGRTLSAARVTDVYVTLTAVCVALFYTSRLPIHAQVTVRYLFPLFPLGVYLLVRLPTVRRVLDVHWRAFCWTLAAGILLGGQLVVVAVAVGVNGIGAAFQLHALLSLSTALALSAWALTGRTERWSGRIGAVLLGLATSSAALFSILTAVEYYALGDTHALPMVRALGELLRLI